MAWSLVQNVTGGTGSTPATALSLTVTAPAINHLVVLCVSAADEAASPPANDNTHVSSITQTNVTWNKATNANFAFNGFKGVDLWYAIAGTSAGTGVTVNVANGGSTTCDIVANFLEWSGNITASVLDSASAKTTGVNTTAYLTNNLTTVGGNELIVATVGVLTTGGPTNGTALQSNLSASGPNAGSQLSSSRQIGSIGTYSELWTGVNNDYGALIAAFFGSDAATSPLAGGRPRIWTLINRK